MKLSHWLWIIKSVGILLGGILLVYWLRHTGLGLIASTLAGLGFWSLPLILNSFFWNFMYTVAWRSYFDNLTHKISFWALFKIKVCGESVNLLTPFGFILGDPMRVYLLEKQLGTGTRLGSVLVDRVLHSFATVLFVLLGVLLSLFQSDTLPQSAKAIVVGIYTGINLFFFFLTRELALGRGFTRLISALRRWGRGQRFSKLVQTCQEIHYDMERFSGKEMVRLVRPFLIHLLGRFLGAVEISLLFIYLNMGFRWGDAVVLSAFTSAGHLLFSFVPGGFGVIESLYGFFFYHWGLDPSLGVGVQLIRRLRAVFWIVVGAVLLSLTRPKKQTSSK